ncbi:hypothetical protein METBIDRAFT_47899 [Metschnikowia bicuspidata var. bicuspidata NRRL YB-4993]|uniref:Transcriptional regulatory protein SDS3 n=1 Tax=Metschnikowia bicuspidata var. bicuspidata NRRL YB-4993 TaxID=869754 RepID=A0A1A0H211_9ASCO|nr:hypothetical protein METBIDRAFT_47899 [Metschnikowia bicuspidata var. bicuspidata NRRL YB-4993]OBA18069.1 hypothetical protein METBIDRAFT_47899 [Metschnikowia bicuspidata var. bicuspidata NRRL YB-4993]
MESTCGRPDLPPFGGFVLTAGGSKKDKRRQQIAARLGKLEAGFADGSASYYRGLLHNLQATLAAIQQGTHGEYVRRKGALEQVRDYELTRLRLWEEYQVTRAEHEYAAAMHTATANYDMMVKLLKEKYYDKLQSQARRLKEDKLLLNMVNASLWAAPGAYPAAAALGPAASLLADRRPRRKREYPARLADSALDELLDPGSARLAASGHVSAGYTSGLVKRRRHYATRYSLNDEHTGSRRRHYATRYSLNDEHTGSVASAGAPPPGAASGNDSNLSDKDYDTLNHLIMNPPDGGVLRVLLERERPGGRPHTRGAHRQFVGVQGLRPDELNDDLTLLRNAVKREK